MISIGRRYQHSAQGPLSQLKHSRRYPCRKDDLHRTTRRLEDFLSSSARHRTPQPLWPLLLQILAKWLLLMQRALPEVKVYKIVRTERAFFLLIHLSIGMISWPLLFFTHLVHHRGYCWQRQRFIIQLLRHLSLLGQQNGQIMPQYYTVECVKNTDGKWSKKHGRNERFMHTLIFCVS